MKRLDWVDIAKGIAILAVVVLHTDYLFPNTVFFPLKAVLGGSWHVPVFFMIGGFFLTEEKLAKPVSFIRGKFKSLYLLAAYFYIPAVLLHNMLISVGWYDVAVEYGGKHMEFFSSPALIKALFQTLFCAGREPILGAVWFVYSLFIALCCMSILSWCIRRFVKDDRLYPVFPMVLLFVCVMSCTMTRYIHLNIPRFNNTLTAMWLIYVGYYVRNKANLKFNNTWAFFLCLIVFLHYCMTPPNGVALNSNKYTDVITLTVGTICALYVICFISIKLQGCAVGSALRKCGEESFYIMALQFVGFKMGCYTLNAFGCQLPIAALRAPTDNNVILMFFFTAIGTLFPIVFMWIFRKVKVALKF